MKKILAMAVLACSGPLMAAEVQSRTNPGPNDDAISRYIRHRLEVDQQMFSPRIDVNTREGKVFLTGEVATLGEERRALEIASAVRGVQEVVDQITVRTTPRTDEEVRRDVRLAMDRETRADGRGIDVGVTNGVAVLTGTVSTFSERDNALEAVQFVRGLRGIENRLEVRSMRARPDGELAADIESLLRSDARLAGLPLNVAVTNGTAMLSGVVNSPAQRNIASRLAQVQGVRAVDVANLTVARPVASTGIVTSENDRQPVRSRAGESRAASIQPTTAERDIAIQQAMSVYLASHPSIDAGSVQVRMTEGVAHLEGRLGTLSHRQQILEALRNLGVTQIVDNLQVREQARVDTSDAAVTQRVQAWFNSDPYLSDNDIAVAVASGRVSIAGKVDSSQEKLRAREIALQVQGVTSVTNQLEVASQRSRLVERPDQSGRVTIVPLESTDALLRDRVRDQLQFDPFMDASRVQVTVDQQGVVLTGSVASQWARARAIENAYEAGATRVVDRLTIGR